MKIHSGMIETHPYKNYTFCLEAQGGYHKIRSE